MTDQPNSPRDWTFRINERQQVTFGELAQVLRGYGYTLLDDEGKRVQSTFVIRDEKPAQTPYVSEEDLPVLTAQVAILEKRVNT